MTDFVFLHGGGQGGWVWNATIAALDVQTGGAFGRALALDGPGCGAKRDRDTSAMTYADVIDDLLADIDRAGFRNCVLVGHSQAGSMIPAMVADRPDLFRKIVYVSCNAPTPGQTFIELMGTGAHGDDPDKVGWPEPLGDASTASRMYPRMFCNDMGEAEAAAFLALLGRDMWPHATASYREYSYAHLGAIPATYVVCLRDGILPVPWQKTFAERHRAHRLVSIDAGHQAMNTRPHALAEILLAEAALEA